VLVARELYVLLAGQLVLRRGLDLKINWWGRLAVWPTMSAIFAALVGWETAAEVLLYVGLVMSMLAAAQYTRDALSASRAAPSS
jgi:phosphatidylglycerophosphate synthase